MFSRNIAEGITLVVLAAVVECIAERTKTLFYMSTIQETTMRYRILIEQDEDGVFVAECSALPGCISDGKTRKEAIENIQETSSVSGAGPRSHGRSTAISQINSFPCKISPPLCNDFLLSGLLRNYILYDSCHEKSERKQA